MSKVIGMIVLLIALAALVAGPVAGPAPHISTSSLAAFGVFALVATALPKFFKG
ncbi:MAG TPA: hypothetical protein VK815_06105 [Candidatus Acidoferrales bacterium]|jgi:hypothetical protein|nr:hypothetical protein [Candidatus Acidoferrales bacterium]